jgi:hypothetical protein
MTSPALPRAEIAYSLLLETTVIAHSNARERDRITGVELAFSVCIIVEGRRHERECGAACENAQLSGA